MAPLQVIILPINDELVPYANEVLSAMDSAGLRVAVDSRTESLNKKVREAQINYIPLIVTIGNREKESGALSVRYLDGTVKYGVSRESFIQTVSANIQQRKLSLDTFPD
jgi:threonyl-tRNA synthetase